MSIEDIKNKVLDAGAHLLIGQNPATAQAAERPSIPPPAPAPRPVTAPTPAPAPAPPPAAPAAPAPRPNALLTVGGKEIIGPPRLGDAPFRDPSGNPVLPGDDFPAAGAPKLGSDELARRAAKNAVGAPERPSIPAPAAEPISPGDRYNAKRDSTMLPAGEAPLLTNRQDKRGEIIGGSEPWSPDRGKIPTLAEQGIFLPGNDELQPGTKGYFEQTGISPKGGGGFTRGGADVAPGDMPTGVRMNGGAAAEAIARWNPRASDMQGSRQNIFADMIPRALSGAADEYRGANTSMTGPAGGDSERTRRMNDEAAAGGFGNSFDRFAGLRGPNDRISKSMVRLREQGMQNQVTMRGQDSASRTAAASEAGQNSRAMLSDATNRRGQEMVQETARYGRDTDLAREGIQQDTSFGVANRHLAASVYGADQNTARAAATSIAKNAGIDDSTINKLLEVSINPDTGLFDPYMYKTNYENVLKTMGTSSTGGKGRGTKYGDGQIGKDRNGRSVIKQNGQWVPYNG